MAWVDVHSHWESYGSFAGRGLVAGVRPEARAWRQVLLHAAVNARTKVQLDMEALFAAGVFVDLSSTLTGTALSSIVDNPDALQQLQDHLPPIGTASQEALKTTLSSPHFQQAVSQFSSALESGQLGPVVSQLAVNPEAVAAAASGNMQEFVKALEKADAKEKAESKDESKKKDDDDEMQLD
ncbi:hypothetical protein HUJ05_012600 [Dendroctonus ponderosae]|nr:hypothetical protein HUJ05_012600 [Dendroctonus ponderosae]